MSEPVLGKGLELRTPAESHYRHERTGSVSFAVGASESGGSESHLSGGYGASLSNGSSSGASSGVTARVQRAVAGTVGSKPSFRRLSSGMGKAEVSNSAGRILGAERNGGSSVSSKPRSGRFSMLARYGSGLVFSQSQGTTSKQSKAPRARAFSLRSGAAQSGASAMGFGCLGAGSSGMGGGVGAEGAGAGLGSRSADFSVTTQNVGLGDAARTKPPFGVVQAGNDGVQHSYGGWKGSSTTVGLGGDASGGLGRVGVGFGRHKYG